MKTQKKASPGNGKNNKVKNNRKQFWQICKIPAAYGGSSDRSGSYGFNGHSALAEK